MKKRSALDDPGHYLYLLDRTHFYARHLGLPEDDAQDCALETAESFLESPPPIQTDWSQAKVKHWLDTRAWHSALNYHKKWKRQQAHKLSLAQDNANVETQQVGWWGDPAGRPDALVLGSELSKRLRKAISRLTPAQQDLFYRRCILQQSSQETAQALGRSTHAVEEALSQTKKRLRKILQEEKLDLAESQDYLAAMSGH